jgi:hypothetical protein
MTVHITRVKRRGKSVETAFGDIATLLARSQALGRAVRSLEWPTQILE